MTRLTYFEQSESWATSLQDVGARSRKIAWTIAGIAVGIAAFEAIALAMLAPLKTVQPITLLVDRHTGYVQSVDPTKPRQIGADQALAQSMLAQYVSAREGFDRTTISFDYRRVALWSAGSARSAYLAEMPATNPQSPFQRYPAGTVVDVRVKSVSQLSPGAALVRFDSLYQDPNGQPTLSQPWISVVRYRFVDAPMKLEDRLINPLGFQVVSYRRDAEVPTPSSSGRSDEAMPAVSNPGSSPPPSPSPTSASATSAVSYPPMAKLKAKTPRRSSAMAAVERRKVPFANVPMGSPLDAPAHPAALAGEGS